MNEQNLRVPSSSQAREYGRKGGLASAKSKAERKTLREELLLLLAEGDTQKKITVAQIMKALDGDTKAFEVIRDTIGEKPKDSLAIESEGITIKIGYDDGTAD